MMWPIRSEMDWSDFSTLVPMLTRLNTLSTLGLVNNTLYDVLDTNNGTGGVQVGRHADSIFVSSFLPDMVFIQVNSTRFEVSCGYIPDSNLTAAPDASASTDVNATLYLIGGSEAQGGSAYTLALGLLYIYSFS